MVRYPFRRYLTAVGIALMLAVSTSALAADPQVKKSKNGICHEAGSTYYARTKHYTPYPSMKACLDSGGRRPKR